MKVLKSLGKSLDTYSAMLTPSRLPTELKKQFVRDYSSGEWTIDEVMASILTEI